KICSLDNAPVFCPIVADFYSGMEVTVSLFNSDIKGTADDIRQLYKAYYTGGLIRYDDAADPDGLLSAAAFSGRDDMQVSVHGNYDRVLLTARFDNLGKGASGAAIQNMNILLGIDESTGLVV
ncbi:MAG: N-acetyl-gamma-glutamyl-phosphate reductase, partial [Oscillospiraceae bacterium]|nr:N-acetyl-gamma-glutamyl-phosphate reductase [Oscillospiraceae bacterium]